MPAQTVIQVRRDTASNWSSANPVLANGEMGYDTTNKLFKVGDGSTAWNSLKVMAQHNTESAARPLLTDGAYLSGSGLVLSGLSGNYASAPDSAALSITGDIDIKVKVAMTDWTPATVNTLVSKWITSGNQRSYVLSVNTSGVLNLQTSVDGTAITTNTSSTVSTGITDGATKWVRATLDVNDGAGNRVNKFYTSDDGTTWTQLGTTVTTAGITTIFDSTAALDIGATTGGTQLLTNGTIYRTIIQSAYDTTDNTTSLVFDANFETATADALAFTESSANAATVTINTTRYHYGIPNADTSAVATATPGNNNRINYTPFFVNKTIIIDMVRFEVTTGPASNANVAFGVYAADDDLQPTGTPLFDTGSIAVASGTTGVFSKQITPVTLNPGAYLIAFNMDVLMTFRVSRGGGPAWAVSGIGATPLVAYYFINQTYGAFPSSGPKWTTAVGGGTQNWFFGFLRWKVA